MIFAQKVLTPGPGTGPKATFQPRPSQSALSGSLFSKPPALPEITIREGPKIFFSSLDPDEPNPHQPHQDADQADEELVGDAPVEPFTGDGAQEESG